jgi:hypothetical protein
MMTSLTFRSILTLVLLLGFSSAPSYAFKEKQHNPACDPFEAEFTQKQEALQSAAQGMMGCAKAGDINYDCSQDFAAIHQRYNEFQTTLNQKLKPCLDTPWNAQKQKPSPAKAGASKKKH